MLAAQWLGRCLAQTEGLMEEVVVAPLSLGIDTTVGQLLGHVGKRPHERWEEAVLLDFVEAGAAAQREKPDGCYVLQIRDLLDHFVTSIAEMFPTMPTADLLRIYYERFQRTPLARIAKEMPACLPLDAATVEVFLALFCRKETPLRHCALERKNGDVVGLVTPLSLLRFLTKHIDTLAPSFVESKVSDFENLMQENVLWVYGMDQDEYTFSVFEAFVMISRMKCESSAVVDDSEKLLAVLKISDFATLFTREEGAELLLNSFPPLIIEAAESQPHSLKLVAKDGICTKESKIKDVMQLLARNAAHQVFVVDEAEEDIRASISLRDLLRALWLYGRDEGALEAFAATLVVTEQHQPQQSNDQPVATTITEQSTSTEKESHERGGTKRKRTEDEAEENGESMNVENRDGGKGKDKDEVGDGNPSNTNGINAERVKVEEEHRPKSNGTKKVNGKGGGGMVKKEEKRPRLAKRTRKCSTGTAK
ncbi:hypothetical protein QOT17_015326 [Balamuthia mandrillaris]